MTKVDFLNKLVMLYPKMEGTLSLYNDVLNLYTEIELKRIFTKIYQDTPTYKPRPNKIKEIADSIGINKSYPREEIKYYYKCSCGTRFTINSLGCPACNKILSQINYDLYKWASNITDVIEANPKLFEKK